jgi:hypothetical protein
MYCSSLLFKKHSIAKEKLRARSVAQRRVSQQMAREN